MQITYVVDTAVSEDRTYLEFWFKGTVYKLSHNKYMYTIQDYDFKEWVQENMNLNCPRVQIQSNKRVHKS